MGLIQRIKSVWRISKEVREERRAREKEAKKTAERNKAALEYRDVVKQAKDQSQKGAFFDVEYCIETLGNLAEKIPEKDRLSSEEILDILETAGMNHTAVIYCDYGVAPANLAFIVHAVAKNQGDGFDGRKYLASVHQFLFETSKKYLEKRIGRADTADACSGVQRCEDILEFTGYSFDEKQALVEELNSLLARMLLPCLKEHALNGAVSDFDSVARRIHTAIDAADYTPAQRKAAKKAMDIYKAKCYNLHFMRSIGYFMAKRISFDELTDTVESHNRVQKRLVISEEDCKKNSIKRKAVLASSLCNAEISPLLEKLDPASRNGNPVLPEDEAKDILDRVNKYMGLSDFSSSEKKEKAIILRRISRFYGWSDGKKPWEQKLGGKNGRIDYKNPLYDRRTILVKRHK